MKGLWKLVALLVVVAAVASLSCFLTSRICPYRTHDRPVNTDFHGWVHKQLNLTPEQDKALDVQEEQFAVRKKTMVEEIQQANAELATAMTQDKEYSPRVVTAVEKIHHAQSDLEKATMEHIFAMKSVLTPEQFDKLLKLTGDALNEPFRILEGSGMDDPDLRLIQDLQGGNDQALDELMQRHKEPLFRFIYRYVLNQEEAQDILQETFVRVYFKKEQFRPTAKFTTWLYHIALNLCRDHARSHSGKQERMTESLVRVSDEGEERQREIVSTTATPSEEAQTNEVLASLERTIQELPHDLKVALILVALEDRPQKECAELLGITVKAVETRVYRARRVLESKLGAARVS